MASKPKFSIITPVYNREDCVGRCIESVLRQGYKSWEMIIVDDGSIDNSFDVVKSYSEKCAQIIALKQKVNRGTNAARNLAISNASGDYAIILDSDDYFADNALEVICEAIDKHPNIRHFLFQADDLLEYYRQNPMLKLKNGECIIAYSDWLSGKIGEDFIHVVYTSIMKKYPFNETTRILEGPNFMRFFKESVSQLYIPRLVTHRERGREDSVTPTALITDTKSMERCYIANAQWLEWFGKDAIIAGYPEVTNKKSQLCALLSLSLGRYSEFSKYKDSLSGATKTVCQLLNATHTGGILKAAIIYKTKRNHRL